MEEEGKKKKKKGKLRGEEYEEEGWQEKGQGNEKEENVNLAFCFHIFAIFFFLSDH